jgi:D-alanyl-D-alanine carboxypeptidase/D-alanyl-D-alanine-endopeptidase (penicillin-binding protein 4)
MLKFISAPLLGLFLQLFSVEPKKIEPVPLLSWNEADIFTVATQEDPTVEKIVQDYLRKLERQGLDNAPGVWVQSDWIDLADNRATTPVSAASLTKIATTLAALEKLPWDYRFLTELYTTGEVKNGILKGDLIVKGSGDPLFVWEEAIVLGNSLNQLGIRKITGNLVITGNFAMNFNHNSLQAGNLLKQALNSRLWSAAIEKQYEKLPPNTPRSQVIVNGTVLVKDFVANDADLILRHQSPTLAYILRQMNIYSNNHIAQMVADYVGGAKFVQETATKLANIPLAEIQLVNGSGLSVDNRISPRAVCSAYLALQGKLESTPLNIADLFPVAGIDQQGTIKDRHIPNGVAIKTGTLAQVSALAGVIPTADRGPICFAIINRGGAIGRFRVEQDELLQHLAQHWQLNPAVTTPKNSISETLGDPLRNES